MTSDPTEPPRPPMRRSERELKVFVSSVMREQLTSARQVVVNTLDATTFLSSWAFEYTPPSSEAADDSYLRHVRDADFVIWLAGAEVTQPVVNEIREALAHDRALIIVRYGTESRSAECQALLDEVGLAAKYGDAHDDEQLAAALELTIGDEIVRALRREPSVGRLAALDELGRASQARCVVRWRAVQLPRMLALNLASRRDVGAPPAGLMPSETNRVVLLTGDVGAGKTICAERHYQEAIAALVEGRSSALPVWLRASDAEAGLNRAVSGACEGLGKPRLQGAAIVVDGLDEAGIDAAEDLIAQARELVETWPKTTVLFTSRPAPFVGVDEERSMPELSDDEAWAAAAIAAGKPIPQGVIWNLPDLVKDAVRRPLFALLFGLWQREEAGGRPGSPAELLAFLAERAVRGAGSEATGLLHQLAVESIRRELRAVPPHDIGRPTQLRALLDSGLVTSRPDGIAFGLPVLAQWFAAQALLEGVVEPVELVAEPADIDLWLYPIAIAVATGTYADSLRLLAPIVECIPGFAFRVIGVSLGGIGPGGSAGSWKVAGERICNALGLLGQAVIPLGKRALPFDDDGRPLPLAVHSDDTHVWTAWWDRHVFVDPPAARPDVFELPEDFNLFEHGPEWRSVRSAIPGPGAGWPWRWARGVISHDLGEMLKARRLPLDDDSALSIEEEWEALVDFTESTPLITERIAIGSVHKKLEAHLAELEADAAKLGVPVRGSTFRRVGGRDHDQYWLRDRLRERRRRGVDELVRPLPAPDRLDAPGSSVDDLFSEEQLIAYVTRLYRSSMEAYGQVVSRHLPRLQGRMALATMMPAQFIGHLRGAVLDNYFVPLPPDSANEVQISFADIGADEAHERAERAYEKLRTLRPESARWITAWSGGTVLNPGARYAVTNVVTKWLWRDLKHASVLEGNLPHSF